jgi:hypothetical protein
MSMRKTCRSEVHQAKVPTGRTVEGNVILNVILEK